MWKDPFKLITSMEWVVPFVRHYSESFMHTAALGYVLKYRSSNSNPTPNYRIVEETNDNTLFSSLLYFTHTFCSCSLLITARKSMVNRQGLESRDLQSKFYHRVRN